MHSLGRAALSHGQILFPRRTSASVSAAAAALFAARREQRLVDLERDATTRSTLAALSLPEAYAVQDAHFAEVAALGAFKIGATNAAAMATLCVEEPFRGFLAETFVRRLEAAGPGDGLHAELRLSEQAAATLVACEAEWCFRLKTLEAEEDRAAWDRIGAAPEGYDVDAMMLTSVVADVFPAVEVVMSRLGHWGGVVPTPAKVADGASSGYVFTAEGQVGSAVEAGIIEQKLARLHLKGIETTVGEHVTRGSGRAVLSHPVHSLTWLVNHLRRHERDGGAFGAAALAGTLVMTGAATGILPVRPGDTFVAKFDEFPTMSLRITQE